MLALIFKPEVPEITSLTQKPFSIFLFCANIPLTDLKGLSHLHII